MKYLIIVLAIVISSCTGTKKNELVVVLEKAGNMIARISEYSNMPSKALQSVEFVNAFEISSIGNRFPILKLRDIDQSLVDFSSKNGKYVFIDKN